MNWEDMPVAVLIGMPGAGKTRVGKLAAQILNLPFTDADQEVEQRASRTISEIVREDGEQYFRKIESDVVCRILHCFKGGIFALGGGSPMTPDIYDALMQYRHQGGIIIHIDADPEEASARAVHGLKRPLLENNAKQRWMELYEERQPVYQSLATASIPSHGTTPKMMAQRLADVLKERVVHVSGVEPYDVHIGPGATSRLRILLGNETHRVALIHTRTVQRHADHVRSLLRQAGYVVSDITIPDAEAGKTVQVANGVWSRLAEDGFTRSDAIVGVGGGAATDLAGFVAATWMRGIKYVNCPTSLLAMVDASVGGKTGINTIQGKNLVGSFYTPVGVLADIRTLCTLPRDIFIEGLGEVAKCGFIMDQRILQILEEQVDCLCHFDGSVHNDRINDIVTELIERSTIVKSRYVSVDLKESGPREFLNYGHTLGHAIEQIEHFSWRHGQAVSVGMVFAAELSNLMGYSDQGLVKYHRELLQSLGLQTSWSGGSWEQVLEVMHRDKKTRGSQLRFIIIDRIGHPLHLNNPPTDAVHAAFERIRSE
ncbi:bifunctional shikimate kinase/3-dehydroquinate synthase [Bombiscardovia coagulans]|uniref:Multifunctional fusion protein n=1 Tax=Bombiscardovia coagulans TaxID=686666 RepID=A0A261ESX7_9BIFI|nr:bifunctional shikimate kinase/3-dehydroquinate synthase [Bombiscardovia coagulans]OZG49967.1 3-dehydroquinate synthase [Bombiscardovia coagulans]